MLPEKDLHIRFVVSNVCVLFINELTGAMEIQKTCSSSKSSSERRTYEHEYIP